MSKAILALAIAFAITTINVGVASAQTLLFKFGTPGSNDGELDSPQGIAVDSADNIYVSDQANRLIQKFDPNGNFLLKFTTFDPNDGEFAYPYGIAVDSAGNIIVADIANYRIQKFDPNGNFLLKFGTRGTSDEEFEYPVGVAVDSADNIYVADDSADQGIKKFDPNGNFLFKIWDENFFGPSGIAIDSTNNIYVADRGSLIFKFGTAQPDITSPTITLLGSPTVTLLVGDAYTDAGATASDNVDGDLTSSIVTFNPVDTSTAGTYTVTYDVSDSSGNVAAQVTRSVEVLTPSQATQNLITQVQNLIPPLNQGQVNSLTAQLNAVLNSIEMGNFNTACNQLDAFINNVNALTQLPINNPLTTSQSGVLINQAQAIKAGLSCS